MAKVLVTIPDDLLARLDREAERQHMSRSALLQRAAQRETDWPDVDVIDTALALGRAAYARMHDVDPAVEVRADRDDRDIRDRRRR